MASLLRWLFCCPQRQEEAEEDRDFDPEYAAPRPSQDTAMAPNNLFSKAFSGIRGWVA